MAMDELAEVRALLAAKPRPVGWSERRERLDEVGFVWPVADDIALQPVDLDGVPGEWSIAPGSNAGRVLLFFHGGGYCSGSIGLPACARASISGRPEGRARGMAFFAVKASPRAASRSVGQRGRRIDCRVGQPAERARRRAARLPDAVRFAGNAGAQGVFVTRRVPQGKASG